MSKKVNPYLSAYASALGRLGGKSKSKAKGAAVRRNGKKGGAPKGNKNACKKGKCKPFAVGTIKRKKRI